MPPSLATGLLRHFAVAGSVIVFSQASPVEAAEPAPGQTGRNASRITARVLSQKVWPPGSLENVRPLVPSGQTLHSLTVQVITSEFIHPELDHLAVAGRTIEIFALAQLPEGLSGKTIQATVKLTGDTQGLRWMIEKLSPNP